MPRVFVVFSSFTVTLSAATAVIVGGWLCGGGVGFFFEPANAAFEKNIPTETAMIKRWRSFMLLFLIEWNLRQNRRLDHVFGFLNFFGRIHELSAWIHQPRRHKNDEVSLNVLLHVGAEKAADDRNIPQDRRAILGLLDVFSHL